MRQIRKEEEKFVKDYYTIKEKLDCIKKDIEELDPNTEEYRSRLTQLRTIKITLEWVLGQGATLYYQWKK